MRVHELAKELGVKGSDVLLLLEEIGVGGKTSSSAVPAEAERVVRARLGGARAAAAPAAPQVRTVRASEPAPPAPVPPSPPSEAPPAEAASPGDDTVRLRAPVSVADFATALDVDADVVVDAAVAMGESLTEEAVLAPELAVLIGEQWGYTVEVEIPEPAPEPEPEPEPEPAPVAAPTLAEPEPVVEEPALTPVVRVVPRRVAPEGAPPRPPVVTVLGHVDHGKTTLLDAIREANVTSQEAGQITQHIGAYQVIVHGRPITFIDTPGHAAFTAMRARGAQVTDIAVLVVAADDGVMPQTVEAIDHAKAAGVPIIVAVNKIDRADASVDAIKQRLLEYEVVSEDWGGDTIFVPISALQKQGIDALLEMILVVADMQELRAVADAPAEGAVLEAELDRRRGPVATLLVQEGTLRLGDAVWMGPVAGKIRAMTNEHGDRLTEAGPSTPVQVIGLSDVPDASELFKVMPNEREARVLADENRLATRQVEMGLPTAPRSLAEISRMLAAGEVKVLNLILKTDVQGSLEAISRALSQLKHEEVRFHLIHAGVGEVTESDASLAAATKPTVIIGFQVGADAAAKSLALDEGIQIRRYDVIYDLVDEVRLLMTGMLETIFEEYVSGKVEVRALFSSSRIGTIAGSYVLEGHVLRNAKVRVIRKGATVHTGVLTGLRHLKDDVSEVLQGFECGLSMVSFNDFQVGDLVECVEEREVRRAGV